MTDPIADYLTRIRNALQIGRDYVEMPSSNLKVEITKLLKDEGYVSDFAVTSTRVGSTLHIDLKYTQNRESVITGLKRVSRPGLRTYARSNQIPRVLGGMGTAVMSTSKGVISGHKARNDGVGGELLALIW